MSICTMELRLLRFRTCSREFPRYGWTELCTCQHGGQCDGQVCPCTFSGLSDFGLECLQRGLEQSQSRVGSSHREVSEQPNDARVSTMEKKTINFFFNYLNFNCVACKGSQQLQACIVSRWYSGSISRTHQATPSTSSSASKGTEAMNHNSLGSDS